MSVKPGQAQGRSGHGDAARPLCVFLNPLGPVSSCLGRGPQDIGRNAANIGVDTPALFEEVSRIVGHPATVNLMMWLTRKDDDRSLASMGFVPTEDAGGFRYKLDW
jgi:hypothetical protein